MSSAVRSASFSLLNQFISVAIKLGSFAILGRLISPVEFGLFGIIIALEALFLPVLDMGLTPVFIKLETATKEVSNVFFTLNVVLGAVLALILCFSAPLLVYIYDEKVLLWYTFVYAVSAILRSLSSQPVAVLTRDKKFDKIMYINQISLLTGTAAGIAAGVAGWGVWALIVISIVQSTVRSFVAFYFAWQNYFFVNFQTIKKYRVNLRFGAEIVVARLVGGVYLSIDKLIFGKIFSVNLLGQYTRAFNLARMPDANIRMAISTPALSHLARLEDSQKNNAYGLMINAIIMISGIPCILFILIGDKIFPWFMGEQWGVAGTYLQILGIWGLGKIMHGICLILTTNEMQMRSIIKFNLVGLIVIYSSPVISAFIYSDPQIFIALLSISTFVYWFALMAFYVYKYTHSKKAVTDVVINLLGIVVSTLLIFINTEKLWGQLYHWGLNTFFSICLFSIIVITILGAVQLALNKDFIFKSIGVHLCRRSMNLD